MDKSIPPDSSDWAADKDEDDLSKDVQNLSVGGEAPQADEEDLEMGAKLNRRTELNEAEAQAKVESETPYTDPNITKFTELKLRDEILKGVVAKKFDRPSQIQAKAIPAILQNPIHHFIGQAQSGSGKTGAFSLGILGRVDETEQVPQAICMAPTRELTRQIHENLVEFAQYTKVKVLLVLRDVLTKLPKKITDQVIVATPGSVAHLFEKKMVTPGTVKIFVLDEADELLKLQGGENTTVKVLKRITSVQSCQVCLFSATYSDKVREFALRIVPSPKITVEIPPDRLSLDKLAQYFISCGSERNKFTVLHNLFSSVTVGQSIIFVHTREKAKSLYKFMKEEQGHSLSVLHGELTDNQRDDVIDKFRNGTNRVLISTNVLARGLDILQVSMVINFDVPMDRYQNPDPESYLHRIGRSARWQNPGIAITLVHDKSSYDKLRLISTHFKKEITQYPANDFEPLKQELERMGVE